MGGGSRQASGLGNEWFSWLEKGQTGEEVCKKEVEGVEVAQGEDDDGEVEAGHVRRETTDTAEVGEELAAGDVGEKHVDVEAVLEGRKQIDDERVLDSRKDVTLCIHMLNLSKPDDFRLSEHLHSEAILRLGV